MQNDPNEKTITPVRLGQKLRSEPQGDDTPGHRFQYPGAQEVPQARGGQARAAARWRFRVYRPPGVEFGEKLPLVVMLHGCGQDANSFAASTRMNRIAMRERFLVLYPEQDRLIARAAGHGRPMILSTGMATYGDILDALRACWEAGNRDVVLLQCTSLYPAPARLANLRAIPGMARAFGVPSSCVTTPEALDAAIRASLSEPGPVLIEVPVGRMARPPFFAPLRTLARYTRKGA